jgi:hypothetical protein
MSTRLGNRAARPVQAALRTVPTVESIARGWHLHETQHIGSTPRNGWRTQRIRRNPREQPRRGHMQPGWGEGPQPARTGYFRSIVTGGCSSASVATFRSSDFSRKLFRAIACTRIR